jgi:ATP-dependent helicase/nuclease subunit A
VRPVIVERLTGWELADPEAPVVADPKTAGRLAPRTLTAEQEQAVERRGEPLLLAAGAGSGKTSVLVERFARAVREDGIAPDRILAITFTERAAAELRERVRARLLALGEREAARASEGAYVGTFHGFCARVLRAHAREAGLREEFEILDEGLAGRLRRQAFAAALGEFVEDGRGEAVDLIAAYGADRARATVLGVYAQLRSRGERAPRLPTPTLGRESRVQTELEMQAEADVQARLRAQAETDAEAARAVGLWDELLELFGTRYEQAKHQRNGLDFDDLELRAGELLARDAAVRTAWAERFELLMVDELQDVNPRQLALVKALERDNLFTVGDEWQSIYGFRHADVSLFRAREQELAARGQSLRLAHNFRGRSELLQAVNAVFATRFGGAFTPLRAGRESARAREAHGEPLVELLLSDRRDWNAGGERIAVAGESGAAGWREAEARALAGRIDELIRGGRASPGGVAVLLRAVGDIECYEQALRAQGLKTVASAGAFWARQEVADLLAYLRALADPLDEPALYGALAAPPADLSSDALGLLARAARAQGRSVWEVARDPEIDGGPGGEDRGSQRGSEARGDPKSGTNSDDADDPRRTGERKRAAQLCAWLEQERELAPELALAALLERWIEHGGHEARLREGEDGERRRANVRKLVELAHEWERSEGRDLRGFLDEAAFQQGTGGFLASAETIAEPDAPVIGEGPPDAVRLMSVHAAKGLEFEVVCVADLGRAPSMGVPDLLVGGERVGVRLVGLVDPEPRPALDYAELVDKRREAQAEEEDRIMYVAMTRARERLLLSGAVDFSSWPRERAGAPPIAWLGPALAPDLPALCAEAARSDRRVGADSARSDPPGGTDSARSDAQVGADRAEAVSGRLIGDRLAPALTVAGTDIPLGCRLNIPGRAT